jgi:hypothetical protein
MDDIAHAKQSRILDLPELSSERETGVVLDISRVVVTREHQPFAWIETTDGSVFRLPSGLMDWAVATVALVLEKGGNDAFGLFPAPVEFGILNGHPYAEFTQVLDVPGGNTAN